MGRRRRTPPKNPRRGPGHNEQNRYNRESRSTSKMLDGGQELRFKYFLEEILIQEEGLEPEQARPVIQYLWAKGARIGLDEARDYAKEKHAEGVYGDEAYEKIKSLMKKYSRYR